MITKKDLNKGQHFLTDKKALSDEINAASLSAKDSVIEIGAGEGVLTSQLIKKSGKVLAFEIDLQYKEKLEALKSNKNNLEIIYKDAMKSSWKGYNKIVSNIPYLVSEQLLNKSIKEKIPELILIAGEKLKEKLEKVDSKIGFITNLFYNIKFIRKVEKNCFSPPPRVNSWLMKFKLKENNSKIDSLLV